jgi:hypothetical protein
MPPTVCQHAAPYVKASASIEAAHLTSKEIAKMLIHARDSRGKRWLARLMAGIGLAAATQAFALVSDANIPDCGRNNANCFYTVDFNGVTIGTGNYQITETGDIQLPADSKFTAPDGSFVKVTDVTGNADPVLGFNASAGTGALGGAFVFNFSLPIALSGPLRANSAISYSLTAKTAAGAEIKPLIPGGKVMTGLEVDTSIGGLPSLDKGVDAGDRFAIAPGIGSFPRTESSPVFTASNSFVGSLAYDHMDAIVAFGLSPNSEVGLSGFIQQVPEPSAYWALVPGFVLLLCWTHRKPRTELGRNSDDVRSRSFQFSSATSATRK